MMVTPFYENHDGVYFGWLAKKKDHHCLKLKIRYMRSNLDRYPMKKLVREEGKLIKRWMKKEDYICGRMTKVA